MKFLNIGKIFKQNKAKGISAELQVAKWLKEDKHFRIVDSHKGKPSPKYYDIDAKKKNKRWAIEVKTGDKGLCINPKSFLKVINNKKFQMYGLILVLNGVPYMLTLNKRSITSEKIWRSVRKKRKHWSIKNKKILARKK